MPKHYESHKEYIAYGQYKDFSMPFQGFKSLSSCKNFMIKEMDKGKITGYYILLSKSKYFRTNKNSQFSITERTKKLCHVHNIHPDDLVKEFRGNGTNKYLTAKEDARIKYYVLLEDLND